MTVFLTSFNRWNTDDVAEYLNADPNALHAYSIAVYQPTWFEQLPVMRTFDIRKDGRWTRPRDFLPEGHNAEASEPLLRLYHDALVDLYWSRRHDPAIAPLFSQEYDVALCCWCPYDTAAKRQLHDYGSFVCHSWPVETVLELWGVEVVRDEDREMMVDSR